jgi:hypothetical protein
VNRGADPGAAVTVTGPRPVVWPAALSATVDLEAASGTVRAGTSPVWVGAIAGGSAPRATPTGRVRVEVLDRVRTERAGVDGLLLRIGRAGPGGRQRGDRGLTGLTTRRGLPLVEPSTIENTGTPAFEWLFPINTAV